MTTEPSPGQVRASDAEREEYAAIIREATSEGRLSLGEGDERLAQVYAARTRDDLRPLIADLPRAFGRRGQGMGPGLEPGLGAAAVQTYEHPYAHVGVARHLGFFLTVSAILVGLWAITASSFFWPAIPISIFAIIVARRAFGFGWHRHYRRRYYR